MKNTHPSFLFLALLALLVILSQCASRDAAAGHRNPSGLIIENQTFHNSLVLWGNEQPTAVDANVWQHEINTPLVYRNCVFNKPVRAFFQQTDSAVVARFNAPVSFINCTFNDSVMLRGAHFVNRTAFRGCTFSGLLSFEGARFSDDLFYTQNAHTAEVRFQNTRFLLASNFLDCSFSETVSFQGANFDREAQFSNGKFYGYTDFSLCEFRSGVFFNYSELVDYSSFNYSRFAGRFELIGATLNRSEMRGCKFADKPNLSDFTLSEKLNLAGSHFLQGLPNLPDMYSRQIDTSGVTLFGASTERKL